MGNRMSCFRAGKAPANDRAKRQFSRRSGGGGGGDRSMRVLEKELVEQQLLAMAIQQQKKAQARLERVMSQRQSKSGHFSSDGVTRSVSAQARSSVDLVDPHQLLNGLRGSGLSLNLETRHFVLVHGGGYGAWCWYKSIALLEEAGFKATAVDLAGSGIDATDPNSIINLSSYVKPLTGLLENLPNDEKVILVGHSFGGACISFAMEQFSKKIAKAVFVTAAMVISGQRAFDVFSPEGATFNDMLRKAQTLLYGNGQSNPPTAIEFDKTVMKDVFLNQSPTKDIALASVSMRPVPFAPVLEKVTLSTENYGSVRRFFVETTEDQALTPDLQERVITSNPPEQVFKVKGGDHSPFFSKPQSLHRIFVEIAELDSRGPPDTA